MSSKGLLQKNGDGHTEIRAMLLSSFWQQHLQNGATPTFTSFGFESMDVDDEFFRLISQDLILLIRARFFR
ncbi:MAG: hypothetical protein ACXADC_00650 [Candidatus Thorarchaeota archaeon]